MTLADKTKRKFTPHADSVADDKLCDTTDHIITLQELINDFPGANAEVDTMRSWFEKAADRRHVAPEAKALIKKITWGGRDILEIDGRDLYYGLWDLGCNEALAKNLVRDVGAVCKVCITFLLLESHAN